jgi:sodium-dependent dicarboxylate transporter 2/3/5
MEVNPAILMLPAVLSASCAFMLPVATAPNAVVFGTGKFSTTRMMREGLALNCIGAVVISTLCYLMLRS